MIVGPCFIQSSFTASSETARAALATGMTSCRTDSSSACFPNKIDSGIVVTIKSCRPNAGLTYPQEAKRAQPAWLKRAVRCSLFRSHVVL
jgi:hypothetical protein